MTSSTEESPMEEKSVSKSFITDRPVGVLMVFAAALVFGYFSLTSLPVTLMPELSYPTITVRTEYPGAAPEEVKNDISRPIEEALGVISGLKRISSISRAGVSDVVLEFTWVNDSADATQDTLEKLDQIRLPDEAGRPLILHLDPALDPVMELSFSGIGERFEGAVGLGRLRRIAILQVKRALESTDGVAAVRVRGGLIEEIHVDIDERQIKRSNLNIQTVINQLRQENINSIGGKVKEGRSEFTIRTLNEYENTQQIEATVLVRLDGKPVRIKDIATVSRSNKEREIMTTTDGLESVQIDIYKEADANMVSMAKTIRRILGTLPVEALHSLSWERQGSESGSDGSGESREIAGSAATSNQQEGSQGGSFQNRRRAMGLFIRCG